MSLFNVQDSAPYVTTPCRFTPGKEPRYSLNRSLGGPHSRSGRFGEKKNLSPLQGFEPRIVQPVA
jgi:hypothetical protein